MTQSRELISGADCSSQPDGYSDSGPTPCKRIVIIDDGIFTGESLHAVEKLANRSGGIIVDKTAILAEGEAYDREDITVLG